MTTIQITVRKKVSTPTRLTSITPGTVGYMHKEDRDILEGIRSCAPCPAVFILKDDSHNLITKQWQYYLLAINPAMRLEDVYYLLDNNLAFTNSTGLRDESQPRQDWFHNEYKTGVGTLKPPAFDKVRTCSRNVVTGVEIYSLAQALKATKNVLQGFQRAGKGTVGDVRQALVTKNVLRVKTFDIRNAPPLKPGRSYPQKIANINPDDYLYLPQHHREMFIAANIVNKAGAVVQFPRGGLYSWTQDSTPYSFLPLCSNPTYGPVDVPLDNFVKLGQDADVPSVYRR